MRALVRKELSVNKVGLIVAFIFPFYLFAIMPTNNKIQLYTVFSIAIIIATIFIILSIFGDTYSKATEILFLSLPIDRRYVIKSKYLVNALFPLTFSVILYLVILLIKWEIFSSQRGFMNFDIVLISSAVGLIVSAFLIPPLIKWKKLTKVLSVSSIIMNSGIFYFALYIRDFELKISYGILSTGLLIIAIVLYVLSMKLSERIYKNQVMNI